MEVLRGDVTTEVKVLPLLQDVEDVFVPYPGLDTVSVPAATLRKLTELLLLLPDVPQLLPPPLLAQLIEVHCLKGWHRGWQRGWH